jgi:DNA repair exonuclease SbcCD nuclease subunit
MVLAAHLADTHLGYAQYRLWEREDDLYELFSTAYEEALRERVNVIVISGDVFHTPRPPNRAILTFYQQVRRAGEKGVKTLVVAGEHDQLKRRGDVHPLLMLSQITSDVVFIGGTDANTVISQRYVVESNGSRALFYGVNAFPRVMDRVERYKAIFEQVQAAVAKESGRKVLVAHLPIEGLMSMNIEPSVPVDSLPSGFDYYALGHLHIRHVSRNKGVLGYPGSLDILSRQEVDEWRRSGKGFYIVDLSREEPEIKKVDLDVRPQFVVEGGKNDVLRKLGELLRAAYRKQPIVHIKVSLKKNEEPEFRDKLENLLRKKVLDYRLEVHREDPKLGVAHVPGESWSEAGVISRVYGISEKAALALIRLKDCLSSRSQPDECENEIRDVLLVKDEIQKAQGEA